MIPFLPKQIATKGISIYLGTLALVSIIIMDYALGWEFLALGVVWVVGFFGLSSYFSKRWLNIPKDRFVTNVFIASLVVRVVWVVFSYFFYLSKTGQPFEFSAADSLWYYEESVSMQKLTLREIWLSLFFYNPTVSDSGYLFYLTLLGKLSGESIIIPRLVNSVFAAFSNVLLFRLASRNIGEEVGRLTGVFACFMPNLVYYCGLHLKEVMMLFLMVAFLERSDYLLRCRKINVWTVLLPSFLLLSLFTFRTVLGITAAFSFVTALVFMRSSVVGKRKRVLIFAWAALAVFTLMGGTIMSEIEGTWEGRNSNQENKRLQQTNRGQQWAKYASGTVMAPMMFVLPFPTLVDVDEQYNQQVINGGNYVRNFMGGFVLIAVFSALFVKKNWRDLSLIGSFLIAYLGVLSMSGFSNSERFLLPGLPLLLFFTAYGISLLNANNYRLIKIWYWIVPLMIVGWAIFKLGSRGLL